MVAEGDGLDHLGAERAQHGEETLRRGDAGPGDDALALSQLLPRQERRLARSTGRRSDAAAIRRRGRRRPAGSLTTMASVSSSWNSSGARSGPAGITRPLPRPRPPSTTAIAQVLGERWVLQAVVHDDDGGRDAGPSRWRVRRRRRSRATSVGATRASSSASSPTSRGAVGAGVHPMRSCEPPAVAARQRHRLDGRPPAGARTDAMTSGVLPVPPAVKLPTQITGRRER